MEKNRYDYLESYTEESSVDEDVGPGDELGGSDDCSDIDSDENRKDGILIRKQLYSFKHQFCVIESDFAILEQFCCVVPEA